MHFPNQLLNQSDRLLWTFAPPQLPGSIQFDSMEWTRRTQTWPKIQALKKLVRHKLRRGKIACCKTTCAGNFCMKWDTTGSRDTSILHPHVRRCPLCTDPSIHPSILRRKHQAKMPAATMGSIFVEKMFQQETNCGCCSRETPPFPL